MLDDFFVKATGYHLNVSAQFFSLKLESMAAKLSDINH